jgi:5-methylcytosine-specific restriction endonuclease McrA
MPVNKSTIEQFAPIFDFTNDNQHYTNLPINEIQSSMVHVNSSEKKIKRSVSETKKKYVASMQDWKCGGCDNKLNAWYEIDHKKRLEYGGTNNVDNLVALCRECHGKKTTIENL